MRLRIMATLTLGTLLTALPARALPTPYRIAATYHSQADQALLIATFKGDTDLMDAALAAGASPNARFPGDLFSEEDAQEFGIGLMENFPAFTRLTQANDQRMTALLMAVRDNQPDMVKWLLAKGADPNMLSGDRKLRPLMQAVKGKNEAMVRTLLLAGADVNRPNADGETALSFAVRYDSPELAAVMLAQGAKVQGLQARSLPLVAGAIAHRRFELAESLIAKGAEVKSRACMAEAIQQGSLEMVQTLARKGTPWDAREVALAHAQRQPQIEAFLREELARRQRS